MWSRADDETKLRCWWMALKWADRQHHGKAICYFQENALGRRRFYYLKKDWRKLNQISLIFSWEDIHYWRYWGRGTTGNFLEQW